MEAIDGLIIPGGESTTMLKLLRDDGLFDALAGSAPGSRYSEPAWARS